jgi:hypothetical protein
MQHGTIGRYPFISNIDQEQEFIPPHLSARHWKSVLLYHIAYSLLLCLCHPAIYIRDEQNVTPQ